MEKDNRLEFIEAVLMIAKRKDITLCVDKDELTGKYPNICIYKNGEFIGKLRWPRDGKEAEVDPSLIDELLRGMKREKILTEI